MTSVAKLLLIKIDLNTSIKGQQPPLDLQRRAAATGIIKPACWDFEHLCQMHLDLFIAVDVATVFVQLHRYSQILVLGKTSLEPSI